MECSRWDRDSRAPSQPYAPPPARIPYATAPAATPGGGPGNSPPVCQNCATSTTPLWRRDEVGSVLCNACGLFLKLHGRPRPISLKTDVIKSRNRVKTGQGPKKKSESSTTPPPATLVASASHRRPSHRISSGASDRSQSPISRAGTPGLSASHAAAATHHGLQHTLPAPNPNSANIAPQHVFDGMAADAHTPFPLHHAARSRSPSSQLPTFHVRQPSPVGSAVSSVNGSSATPTSQSHHLEAPPTYDALLAQANALKTRVSELEVINGLFRGRVAELENSEQEARRCEALAREAEARTRGESDDARMCEVELRRRMTEGEDGHRNKRMRLSDIVDESAASTPLSDAQSS
ncbi:hypothetical protein BDY21DRAFT_288158 [Lineolata rhizophorae]|uniref:GATA-type domain-containing protein n=1 Tax=Lineolata rhizophorae TaxID=578093 RepID=A0A6A6NXK9_9PEZI|nr:hypothetical protein BDY21DRAFT_288158 [Lineolata rhizophorae]